MCAVEDAEPWTLYREDHPKARKPWPCGECRRTIAAGERYQQVVGLADGLWVTYRTCAHCNAASRWMSEVCGGYILGDLLDELVEHWHEGFADVAFGRLIVGLRLRWHDGADPVPEGVAELASRMLQRQVAA
jgi:hypothetical protein